MRPPGARRPHAVAPAAARVHPAHGGNGTSNGRGARISSTSTSTALLRARSLEAERRGRDPCTSCRCTCRCSCTPVARWALASYTPRAPTLYASVRPATPQLPEGTRAHPLFALVYIGWQLAVYPPKTGILGSRGAKTSRGSLQRREGAFIRVRAPKIGKFRAGVTRTQRRVGKSRSIRVSLCDEHAPCGYQHASGPWLALRQTAPHGLQQQPLLRGDRLELRSGRLLPRHRLCLEARVALP